jgi:hypothetical protein
MKILLVISLLFTTGCIKVRGKVDPIEVKPINVEHIIKLDTDALYDHFLEICREELPDATIPELRKCADDRLNNFIEKFTDVI